MGDKNIDEMAMDLRNIVNKLAGKVFPVGETHADNQRFENLKVLCGAIELLLTDIDDVTTHNINHYEFSRKRAGEYAKKFFDSICVTE